MINNRWLIALVKRRQITSQMLPSLDVDPVGHVHSSEHPDLTDQLTISSNVNLILRTLH
jgi:hypothetical protein